MWKPSGSSEASMNVCLRAASSSTGLQGVEAFYKVPAEGAQWGLLSDLTQPAAQGTASQNRPMGLLRIANFTPSLIIYVAMGKYFEQPVASLRDTKHFTAGHCQQTLCRRTWWCLVCVQALLCRSDSSLHEQCAACACKHRRLHLAQLPGRCHCQV